MLLGYKICDQNAFYPETHLPVWVDLHRQNPLNNLNMIRYDKYT